MRPHPIGGLVWWSSSVNAYDEEGAFCIGCGAHLQSHFCSKPFVWFMRRHSHTYMRTCEARVDGFLCEWLSCLQSVGVGYAWRTAQNPSGIRTHALYASSHFTKQWKKTCCFGSRRDELEELAQTNCYEVFAFVMVEWCVLHLPSCGWRRVMRVCLVIDMCLLWILCVNVNNA